MHVHIIDHKSVHLPLIAHLLTGSLPDLQKITFSKTDDDHQAHIDTADLIVLSGGTRLVHLNPDTHRRLVSRLVKSRKPVFGICLGAEAIAQYFGAELEYLSERISGLSDIEVINPAFSSEVGKSVTVFHHHRWSIVSPPQDLIIDAQSESGVELFHHQSLPIWGSQFHPEARRGGNQGFVLFNAAMRQLGFNVKGPSH